MQANRRLHRTSQAREFSSARTLMIRPAIVAREARDSRVNGIEEEGSRRRSTPARLLRLSDYVRGDGGKPPPPPPPPPFRVFRDSIVRVSFPILEGIWVWSIHM